MMLEKVAEVFYRLAGESGPLADADELDRANCLRATANFMRVLAAHGLAAVPREATGEMISAGFGVTAWSSDPSDIWRVMVRAAEAIEAGAHRSEP